MFNETLEKFYPHLYKVVVSTTPQNPRSNNETYYPDPSISASIFGFEF
jgi:hypothetical protein